MGRADATLAFLQDELEAIYGVEAPRVHAFVMGEAAARAAGRAPRAPEELLVLEEQDGVALGLYLADEVMRAAAAADPHDPRPRLTARGALGRLACAAEGVSHFVYLATRAAAGRPVSLLELEVQAEVDKFALLVLHLWRRGLRRMSPALRRRLFERVAYRAHLGAEELHRYREANRLGGGYARWLEGRYVEEADVDGLLRELRRSYRLGGGEKLGYLGTRTLQ
ncbi:hypothetical protein [Anaeromyxobacter sp. PSR-1]|uniref:hypothetical protein n=1 Tax=unclassified Anaeromyxobacter TaxID=2620896 RepID=UPI0005E3B60F|nr:hypothetical protein [Anaeromyxobacter sp. PSR-1]GAO02819.1 hypothetical protein PSR1_01694 [Anaeromyxobacter sp. PSR-1]